MLRREGYQGSITMVSADADAPVDRPNLSKDYLAGEAKEDWIPLWPPSLYSERRIDLRLGSPVVAIDAKGKTVALENGARLDYGALLLATGAEPVRLPVPGNHEGRILYLRTFADSRSHRRAHRHGQARRRHRRELHRARGGGIAAHAGDRSGRRRTGPRAARACHGARGRPLRAGAS